MEPTETNNTEANDNEGAKAPANMSLANLASLMKSRSSAPAGGEAAPAKAGKPAATGAATQKTDSSSDSSSEDPENENGGAAGEEAGAGGDEAGDGKPEGDTTAEGDEPEADSEAEGDEANVPKAIKDLQKRVGKLTARAKTAEEQLAATQAELAKARETKPAAAGADALPATVDPVQSHPAVRAARVEEAKAINAANYAKGLLNQLGNDEKAEAIVTQLREAGFAVGDADAAAATLREMIDEARQLATKHGLKADFASEQVTAQFEAMRKETSALAESSYAWLKGDPSKAEATERAYFESTAAEAPWILKMPMGRLALADMAAGRAARERAAAAAGKNGKPSISTKVKPGTTPAAVVTKAGAAAPKVDGKKAQVAAAETQLTKSGRTKDLAKMLQARAAAGRG